MCTGRGRALVNTVKARDTRPGTSDADRAVALNAVKGAVAASWDVISCRRPRPMPRSAVPFTLESTSMGTESE